MSDNKSQLPFAKENYWIMFVGIGLILFGFLVMATDSTTFGFGFTGLTLGPVMVFSGFMVQIVAILFKKKKS
jgi:uncharacterized membrane protein HdeD (DUF308 family)